jgi:hypothetical protein
LGVRLYEGLKVVWVGLEWKETREETGKEKEKEKKGAVRQAPKIECWGYSTRKEDLV